MQIWLTDMFAQVLRDIFMAGEAFWLMRWKLTMVSYSE